MKKIRFNPDRVYVVFKLLLTVTIIILSVTIIDNLNEIKDDISSLRSQMCDDHYESFADAIPCIF